MRKIVRKQISLPEIQEEGFLTPLRRRQSAYVQSSSMEIRKLADLKYGPQGESPLTPCGDGSYSGCSGNLSFFEYNLLICSLLLLF